MNLSISALLGAITAPLCIQLSYAFLLPRLVPASSAADCGTPFLFKIDHIGFDVASGAVLGVLSALCFKGDRSQFARFGAFLGGCVFAYYAWVLTATLRNSLPYQSNDAILRAQTLSLIPLLLWAFVLFICSVLTISRTHRSAASFVHS